MAYPLLTGAAVVAVTMLGDRLGGRVGGILATAPVTTTVAHVVIATSVAPHLASARVLQGIAALLASTFGIVAFFYAVKYTRGSPSNARLTAGLGVYVAAFLALTFVFATWPLPPITGFTILFLTHAALAFTFMREPVPMMAAPARAKMRPLRELALRFLAGALVVAAIRVLVHAYPPFAGALAVVPAVFVVSLAVMGARDARVAARAAQAGLFGTTSVALFVLVVAAGLALGLQVWATIPFAWGAYALGLATLGRVHARIAR